jgi:hypothetical protein
MTILDELVRHDGLQGYTSPLPCSNCLDDPGVYRCLDCGAISLYCAVCLVSRHDELPLHRIEVCPQFSTFSPTYPSCRYGPMDSISGHRFLSWALPFTSATNIHLAHTQIPVCRRSSSSILTARTTSMSNFAHARRVQDGLNTTVSYYGCGGTPPPSIDPGPRSLLTFLTHFTSLHFRENSTFTTSTNQ